MEREITITSKHTESLVTQLEARGTKVAPQLDWMSLAIEVITILMERLAICGKQRVHQMLRRPNIFTLAHLRSASREALECTDQDASFGTTRLLCDVVQETVASADDETLAGFVDEVSEHSEFMLF